MKIKITTSNKQLITECSKYHKETNGCLIIYKQIVPYSEWYDERNVIAIYKDWSSIEVLEHD